MARDFASKVRITAALFEGFLAGAGDPGTHIQVTASEYARLTLAVDRLLIDSDGVGRE